MVKSMRDFITPKERMTNPYVRQIVVDAGWGLIALGFIGLFIYQVVLDITMR